MFVRGKRVVDSSGNLSSEHSQANAPEIGNITMDYKWFVSRFAVAAAIIATQSYFRMIESYHERLAKALNRSQVSKPDLFKYWGDESGGGGGSARDDSAKSSNSSANETKKRFNTIYHSPKTSRENLISALLTGRGLNSSGSPISNSMSARSHPLRFEKFERIIKSIYYFRRSFLTFLLIKYLVVCTIGILEIKSLWWIDCYFPGRFMLDGRITHEAKYLGLIVIVFHIVWDVQVLLWGKKFDFQCCEFISRSYTDTLLHEIQFSDLKYDPQDNFSIINMNELHTNCIDSPIFNGAADGCKLPTRQHQYQVDQSLQPPSAMANNLSRRQHHQQQSVDNDSSKVHQSIYYFNNLFVQHLGVKQGHLVLRPNRTTSCWIKLTQFSFSYISISIISLLITVVPIASYTFATIAATKPGFEVTYSNCVDWINNISQEPQNYTHIYQKPRRSFRHVNPDLRPYIFPFDEKIQWNSYGLYRMYMEMIDNTFLYVISLASFVFYTYLGLLTSHDLKNYAGEILVQLTKLINSMEAFQTHHYHKTRHSIHTSSGNVLTSAPSPVQHEQLTSDTRFSDTQAHAKTTATLIGQQTAASLAASLAATATPSPIMSTTQTTSTSTTTKGPSATATECWTITQVQAQISDYFLMLARYNNFVSFYTLFCIIVWICFSAVTSCWMFLPGLDGGDRAKIEWLLGQLFATAYMIAVIGQFASIRVESRKIYTLLSNVMALDSNLLATKGRWATLMECYTPTPLYCFTIFKSSEISWFFIIKVGSGCRDLNLNPFLSFFLSSSENSTTNFN